LIKAIFDQLAQERYFCLPEDSRSRKQQNKQVQANRWEFSTRIALDVGEIENLPGSPF